MRAIGDHQDIQNLYAHNVRSETVYVYNVPSGLQGYFCMGCNKEMQAVKSNIHGRKSYFRHHAIGIEPSEKCTYRDETYRHKIAKEALHLAKSIKVPNVVKYPLTGSGPGMLIAEAKFIEAHTVRNELQFYEDDEGNIKWGRNVEDGKHLIIRPDVTFFDKNGKPILLIEIVATRKPSEEKLLKLLRLGIDTVSVIIPKDSPEAISAIFNTTAHTKWIYNHEQESTEYLPVSDGSTAGILPTDEEQRRLFAESYKCRASQINNLIRTIGRCLDAEQFRRVTGHFNSEISRVERNTEQLRSQFRAEQEEYQCRIDDGDQAARAEYCTARDRNFGTIESIKRENAAMEERYLRETREIDREQQILNVRIEQEIRDNGGDGKSFEQRKAAYRRERDGLELSIGAEEIRIDGIFTARGATQSEFERNRGEIVQGNQRDLSEETASLIRERAIGEGIPGRFERIRIATLQRHATAKTAIEEDIRREQDFSKTLSGRYEAEEATLGAEFDRLRASAISGIKERDYERNSYLSKGYQDVLLGTEKLHDAIEIQRDNERSRAIKEFLAKGTYKVWL